VWTEGIGRDTYTILTQPGAWRPDPDASPVRNFLATLDGESRALAISVAWLVLIQFLAVLAWGGGLLSREAAVVHWVLLGVLPPAMALAGMANSPPD
jgi:hypothetical protein